jgi:hypothetical protein
MGIKARPLVDLQPTVSAGFFAGVCATREAENTHGKSPMDDAGIPHGAEPE